MNDNLNETEYHRLADAMLDRLLAALEEADGQGALEVESQGGVLTIEVPPAKHYVVSKHVPTRQLWLSSPVSGGLHFDYNVENKDWQLRNGQKLAATLFAELQAAAGITLV